jgi:hypothetical protein
MAKKKANKANKPKEILENQLHQQLAENDNNRNSVFSSFIVGIIALFGFYGYVFVNTNRRKYWNFDIQEFLLMSFVTIGILFFLAILALNLGYSYRRDQFIVHNIRKERYKNKEEMEKIFGNLYSPQNKNILDFIPNFYNLFYWLFLFSEIFILFTAILKVFEILKINDIINNTILFYKYYRISHIVMLFHVFFIFLTIIFRFLYYLKYKNIKH